LDFAIKQIFLVCFIIVSEFQSVNLAINQYYKNQLSENNRASLKRLPFPVTFWPSDPLIQCYLKKR